MRRSASANCMGDEFSPDFQWHSHLAFVLLSGTAHSDNHPRQIGPLNVAGPLIVTVLGRDPVGDDVGRFIWKMAHRLPLPRSRAIIRVLEHQRRLGEGLACWALPKWAARPEKARCGLLVATHRLVAFSLALRAAFVEV